MCVCVCVRARARALWIQERPGLQHLLRESLPGVQRPRMADAASLEQIAIRGHSW